MRYLEQLIDRSREMSQNIRYDANSGISQRTYVQYFQNAQEFLVREIVNSKSKYLLDRLVIPVVNRQEEYTLPSTLVLQGIDSLQWSQDQIYWTPLEKCITKDQQTSMTGYPFGYIVTRRSIIVTPYLQYGYLRFNFNKRVKRIEKRSAKIQTTVAGPTITSIALDSSYSGDDQAYIDQFSSISIVDRNGTPVVSNMPITSCSGNTIVVPSYTLGAGESVTAGNFILAGGDATNLPDFDDLVESFLILHATYQAKYGDSSQWSIETKNDVVAHFKQISAMFGTLSEDVNHIPITCQDFLSLW